MSIEAPAVPTEIDHRGVDPRYQLVREAPTASLTTPDAPTAARPDASDEDVLEVWDIQGNVVAGFNKDFQTLLFLRVDDAVLFKPWLTKFAPLVATAEEVIAFNRLFKRMSDRRGYRGSVKATWINIAFSYAGLAKLTPHAADLTDPSFQAGAAARSASLGDPTADDAEGNPKRWLVRDGEGGADVLIIVAADTASDLEAEVARVEQAIFAPRADGTTGRSGAALVFKQEGRTQLGALAGHEHFGFKDGISQPGLRGRVSENHYDVLTLRQNPDDPDQGKPGQELIWPGEFVFGYPGEGAERAVPDWVRNGSYLVFRRLQQDVFKFHSFLRNQSTLLNLTPEALGARVVGRWASGAPVIRAPRRDDPLLGDNDCANNHFDYRKASIPIEGDPRSDQCSDATFPQSTGDPDGDLCPFSSHIRKAYPRDDVAGGVGTQTHRLLRRGIPYGTSSRSTPSVPVHDDVDRGLLFMAYMTSITAQFEFVLAHWVNGADFRQPGAGVDVVLGQASGADGGRRRVFNVRVNGRGSRLTSSDDWVVPTGGGYFFAPSISALEQVLGTRTP